MPLSLSMNDYLIADKLLYVARDCRGTALCCLTVLERCNSEIFSRTVCGVTNCVLRRFCKASLSFYAETFERLPSSTTEEDEFLEDEILDESSCRSYSLLV